MKKYKIDYLIIRSKKFIRFINRKCSSVMFVFEVTRLKNNRVKIRVYSKTNFRFVVISIANYKDIISTQKNLIRY